MSIYTQARFRFPGRPRHQLGLYIPYAKSSSRIYVPTRRERAKLVGKRPFDIVFGGPQDDVVLLANQSIQLRYTVQQDFIATSLMCSSLQPASVGRGAPPPVFPSFRVEILDLSSMAGRGKHLSTTGGCNDVNVGGTGKYQKYFRHLYTFHAGRTIIARVVNLLNATNNIQIVIGGVM